MVHIMEDHKLVVLESPFAGDVKGNIEYAQLCMRDSLLRGESPYASHLLYTQPNVLDDDIPEERDIGINAGFAFKHLGNMHTVFYLDKGMSFGMHLAKDYIIANNLSYEERYLYGRD